MTLGINLRRDFDRLLLLRGEVGAHGARAAASRVCCAWPWKCGITWRAIKS
jgi:hypothetical protein